MNVYRHILEYIFNHFAPYVVRIGISTKTYIQERREYIEMKKKRYYDTLWNTMKSNIFCHKLENAAQILNP